MAASRKAPLRAVGVGERPSAPPSEKPKTVAQAAKGTTRDLLVAMRDRIATAVTADGCPPRDLASLTKRLADIAGEIAAMDARSEADQSGRLVELERALAEVAPDHPLLISYGIDDRFDASAI